MSQYQTINIDAPAKVEEELTMLFFDHGAAGVAIEDPAIIKEHLLKRTWDASVFDGLQIDVGRIKIVGTLTTNEDGRKAAKVILQELSKYDDIIICEQDLPDIDWQKKWRDAFSGHSVGSHLWVRPYWEKNKIPEDKIDIVIEPSLAFGTGDHATTAMSMEMIEDYLRPDSTFVDLGCGSGILAIVALCQGAKRAIGVDIDPVCEDIVRRHCELNNIDADKFDFCLGDITSDSKLQEAVRSANSHLIVANITADIICNLCPYIKDILAADGVFVCSGIIKKYEEMVQKAFTKAGLCIIEKREEDDWLAYALKVETKQKESQKMYAVAHE